MLRSLPDWQGRILAMATCAMPGVILRLTGVHVPPPLGLFVFGGAVMAAGFLLAWAAEAAEIDLSPGLAVAGVAFVAVLPEYVIEVYFAYSGHVEYVTASLTGSTRLLLSLAVGMPALASIILMRSGFGELKVVELARPRRADLAVIAAASLYAPLIVVRGQLAWQDALVLVGLYVIYIRRVSSGEPEPPHLVGVSAELGKLDKRGRRRWVAGLMGFAVVAVLCCAEPFASSVLGTGRQVGVSPYLLVQWLVPMATEMPEIVIAFVLVHHRRPAQGVAVLLSSAVSQWTLALGTLPVAFLVGAGSGPLPLAGREQVEVLLTIGLGLLAVAVLVTLKLNRRDAVLMLALFVVQLALPSPGMRAALSVVYLVLAIDILSSERWAFAALRAELRPAAEPRRESARTRPAR